MTRLLQQMRSLGRETDGATMPEYALMVALIAVVCIVAVQAVGLNALAQFNTIAAAILNA